MLPYWASCQTRRDRSAFDLSPGISSKIGRIHNAGWGKNDEEEPIHRKTDHRDFARAGGQGLRRLTSAASGTTLRPASRPKTPSSRASTAGCATSYSTRRCSPRSRGLAPSWLHGRTITTTFAHTVRSASDAERIHRSQCLPTATGRGAAL